ncbi:beta-N-acetylglucosaminidase, partial [hydrothermal vent metagenome]
MTAIICGIASTQLQPDEIQVLNHPLVCGVILFKRNFESYNQLQSLVNNIKSKFGNDFLISVDQEGGRVTRFGLPFCQLPPVFEIGKLNQSNSELAKSFAQAHAWLMASELLSINIDLSFAPVLDIDNGSDVIGDRAFSTSPNE